MDKKTQAELGSLLIDTDKLLELLAQNPSCLDDYPHLQSFISDKNKKSVEYRRAIREKQFSKDDYRDAIFERLDWIGYEICTKLDTDFLINRVAAKAGADIEAINKLTVKEIGVENISKLLHLMGNAAYSLVDDTPSYPWEAVRGQANDAFWKRCHLAYDAYQEGFNSHWKLNEWCQAHLDVACPQSFPKFVKMWGDPRNIPSWLSYSGWSDKT